MTFVKVKFLLAFERALASTQNVWIDSTAKSQHGSNILAIRSRVYADFLTRGGRNVTELQTEPIL